MTSHAADLTENSPTFLDLFCGAGGLTRGFENAGFHCMGAADFDKAAIKTHCANFTRAAWLLDVVEASPQQFPRSDVIVGGPPCQGFSSAGMRDSRDERNDLVARFAHFVAELRPRAFVFENVEGFLTAAEGHYVFALLRPLVNCGYKIHARKINAANYGVPQHRKRIVVIGGLDFEPTFPDATHTAFGAPGAALGGSDLPPTPTLDEVLRGLPAANCEADVLPQGHFYRELRGIEWERAVALQPGQSMRDLPTELQHASFRRRAFRRVQDGTLTERRGGAPTGVRRLRGDQPSKAITGGARAEFLHPREHRALTLRECARLQTFPDDFVFRGTTSQQAQLIGNAVPPLLARILAENLRADLQRCSGASASSEGKLLSFVPTLAQGTSPILKRVIEAVRAEFGWNVRISMAEQKELSLWP